MSLHEKSIVASGHTMVSQTAAEIIREGGNAFDAIVGAGFASAVVEPCLTSLGGGGLLIGHHQDSGQSLFFDFFAASKLASNHFKASSKLPSKR